MPSPGPYIPPRDADYDVWLHNFSTVLTGSPAAYGQSSSTAASVASAYAAWHTAYVAAVAGATRGPTSIAAKDDQRVMSQAIVRPIAIAISLNAGITADAKITIGVNPRTSGLTPIVAPTSNPIMSLIGAQHLVHILRYQDSAAPASVRAKPFGATSLQLFGAASTTVVTDPSILPLVGAFTKIPLVIAWDSSDQGKTVYYAARWATRRGDVGPWSPILPLTVL